MLTSLSPSQRIQLWSLCAVSLNLRPALTAIGPLIDVIHDQLQLSRMVISLLTALPVLCMGLFAPLAPYAVARFGRERTITLSLVAIGLGCAMRLLPGTLPLFGGAVWIGLGIAVAGPTLSGFIKENYTEHIVPLIALYTVAIGVGATAGAALALPLAQALPGGWSSSLAAWSFMAFIAAVVWHRYCPSIAQPFKQDSPFGHMPLKEKRAWRFLFLFMLQSGVSYTVLTWVAPQFFELGMTRSAAGLRATALVGVQLLATLLMPLWAAKSANRIKPMAIAALSSLVGCIGLTLAPLQGDWWWVFLLGWGTGGFFPLVLILPLDEARDASEASAWTAMMLTGGYLLSSGVPVFVGALRDWTGDYRAGWLLSAGCCIFMLGLLGRCQSRPATLSAARS